MQIDICLNPSLRDNSSLTLELSPSLPPPSSRCSELDRDPRVEARRYFRHHQYGPGPGCDPPVLRVAAVGGDGGDGEREPGSRCGDAG